MMNNLELERQERATSAERFAEALATLGPSFADRALAHDAAGTFVVQNYADLKQHHFFSAGVPTELGGGGLSYAELCQMLRELAHFCPSTALAFSMHQHLVAATVWRYKRGLPGEPLLRRIAAEQLVLVSSGGRDWLASNGEMVEVEGGYRVSARKTFASGCEVGDLLMASARYQDAQAGAQVLHFAVPLESVGISLLDDWDTLGMRGTGSRTVVLNHVFIPSQAVSLKRPAGQWHSVWGAVLASAMPMIMSVYLGAAEQAVHLTVQQGRRRPDDPHLPYLLGELTNALTTAELAVDSLVALNSEYRFEPQVTTANAVLVRKTIATNAVAQVARKALEASGGVGFFRRFGLEKLLRDLHGAPFHPLPEKAQQLFTGRLALGLEAVQP